MSFLAEFISIKKSIGRLAFRPFVRSLRELINKNSCPVGRRCWKIKNIYWLKMILKQKYMAWIHLHFITLYVFGYQWDTNIHSDAQSLSNSSRACPFSGSFNFAANAEWWKMNLVEKMMIPIEQITKWHYFRRWIAKTRGTVVNGGSPYSTYLRN